MTANELFEIAKEASNNNDVEKAIKYYQLAADQGHDEAMVRLGVIYLRQSEEEGQKTLYEKALELIEKSANLGNAKAQCLIGVHYKETGNYAKAKGWLEKAAQQDIAGAWLLLGDMYEEGLGVRKDASKATEHYLKSAELGDNEAQCKLAGKYFQGNGCDKDYKESYKWMQLAAENGNKVAKEMLAKHRSTYESLIKEGEPKSGCYVATAVYGSYDCPEVWTLRRYRDNRLAKTWYGRAFIKTYYAISPTLVKWFGKKTWFKNFWLKRLNKFVTNLKEQGFEDTPYND